SWFSYSGISCFPNGKRAFCRLLRQGTPMPKSAAIYARVSTRNGHQDPEVQLLVLRKVAKRAGWKVVEEYVDHGISGAKGRDKRPAFDRLLKDATRRRFDVIMAWSVDRLGRS